MATSNEIHIQSERLLQELAICKFTVTPYNNLFDKDAFLKEFLAFKMDIVEGIIEGLYSWEKTGNKTKCKNAIDNAEFYLGQIQVLFDGTFADQYQETWQDTENVSCGMPEGKEVEYQSA